MPRFASGYVACCWPLADTRALVERWNQQAAQQLIGSDPPQLGSHQGWRLGLELYGIVGGRLNSGVRLLSFTVTGVNYEEPFEGDNSVSCRLTLPS